jgi:S1-C subfamily serine protease
MRGRCLTSVVCAAACALVGPRPGRAQGLLDAHDIAERVGPAVAFVRVYHEGGSTTEGSGFVVASDGWIVTNQHVLGDSQEVEVWLPGTPGFRRYRALVILADPLRDLALLRVDGDGLRTVALAPPGAVQPGMAVASLGYPEGIFSMQRQMRIVGGVVSHIGFPLGDLPERAWLVSDVKLREGNSGGPLVDAQGRVVGVNTVRRLDGETSLSIPVEDVWGVLADLNELRSEFVESWRSDAAEARGELRAFERAVSRGRAARGPITRVLARREIDEAGRLLDASTVSLGTGRWEVAREQLRGALVALRWLRGVLGAPDAQVREASE